MIIFQHLEVFFFYDFQYRLFSPFLLSFIYNTETEKSLYFSFALIYPNKKVLRGELLLF